ncbi:uncharacterized protein LOC143208884 [Lasioglossum baleicum]|uniref:uncharacterized protein LOC143208884 n=1 Tax=Lasioglossum baleicum TaxID=434251 RepID=UPI003FCCDCB6
MRTIMWNSGLARSIARELAPRSSPNYIRFSVLRSHESFLDSRTEIPVLPGRSDLVDDDDDDYYDNDGDDDHHDDEERRSTTTTTMMMMTVMRIGIVTDGQLLHWTSDEN